MQPKTIPPVVPGRKIDGISAVLLPFQPDGLPDSVAWESLVERTWNAGLTPAINMDTGYANLLNPPQRHRFLIRMADIAKGRRFVAGAFIEDQSGSPEDLYRREMTAIRKAGGIPILFPSSATGALAGRDLAALYRRLAGSVPEFLGFELGKMFVPFGRIWDSETFQQLIDIPQMTGAKHSSLSRETEWERLRLRNDVRPEFRIYTGNDLAIDMVQWGSDYLLGLSAFYPEAFAARDRCWGSNDPRFFELNDGLQYLGMLAFRPPVPAYKHTCAQFLELRGLIPCSAPPRGAYQRPSTDREMLEQIRIQLDERLASIQHSPTLST